MTKKLLLAAALLTAIPALAAEESTKKEEPKTQAPPSTPPETVPPEEGDKGSGRIGQSPFRVRTSRPSYAEQEVARPLALQKEWAEFGLTYQFKEVTQFTDSEGNVEDATYTYTHSWLTLDARYGFTRNLTMYMSLPYSAYSTLEADNDDADASTRGLGDVHFGFVWQVLNKQPSPKALTSVVLQLDTKQPSGNESVGAPGNRHLPLGTGTTNAGLSVAAKQRVGPVAAIVRAGYVHKFSGTNMWVRDIDAPTIGLNGRFKPGNEITAGGHLILQPISLIAVQGGADYVNRGEAAIGATSDSISPGDDVVALKDTDFEALNASVRLFIEPSINWDFIVGFSTPVMSRNSQAFMPLEDLTQSYGNTITGSAIFRW